MNALLSSVAMTDHAVVIVGGGPTGLMLAGELALAGIDVVIVERRASQDLAGSRAAGSGAVGADAVAMALPGRRGRRRRRSS